MSSNPQDINPMVSTYKKLFVALSIVTLIGIAVAVVHVPLWIIFVLGGVLFIVKSFFVYESFKKFLVGRNLIIITFLLTLIFMIGLLILPILNHQDHIVGTEDISKQLLMEKKDEGGHGH